MTKPRLILIGGGGHCCSALDVVRSQGVYEVAGILDKPDQMGRKILDVPFIGTDEDIAQYAAEGLHFLITVGQIKDYTVRSNLFSEVQKEGGTLATVISPRAWIAPSAQIGLGCLIAHDALVNANAIVGDNCILNTKCILEHGSVVSSNCHISTGAIVNGECQIGKGSFIGSGSVVSNNLVLGERCVVGAGTTVLRDLPNGATYTGFKDGYD